MPEQFTISKGRKLLDSENYAFLRKEGIKIIEKLASSIWTDYNTHDPGITILELLCYAITDQSYRTSYDLKDILAEKNGGSAVSDSGLYSAAEIFPSSPVTITDFRKLLVDIKGVRNAWLKAADVKDYRDIYLDKDKRELCYTKAAKNCPVDLKGMYQVLVEFEEEVVNPNKGGLVVKKDKAKVIGAVRNRLYEYRNLCEDFSTINEVLYEDIAVCADIEVDRDADIELILARIYSKLGEYFSPQINFYTIQEMLDKNKSIAEVFEGPLLEHGFVDAEEIEKAELRTELRVSDIINFIMDIDGVVAVRSILLTSYVDGTAKEINKDWILRLSKGGRAPRLSIKKSKVIFYKDILPYIANPDNVAKKLKEIKEGARKYRLTGHQKDLPVPQGRFRDIEAYQPVQHEFPLCYGIGEEGLPSSATALRKAQAKQLKAYLLFFEQVLANYLSQLANVGNLFSFDEGIDKTYFTRVLSPNELKDLESLYLDYDEYKAKLHGLVESDTQFEKRRNRFLNHLLARFSEEIMEYSLLLFSLMGKDAGKKLIEDKIRILEDYPAISSERGKAFNYKDKSGVWDTGNVAGMKKRVARLLGFDVWDRRCYANEYLRIEKIDEGRYVIRLHDPYDTTSMLMASIEYPNEECAEGILQYMLAYGDNPDKYVSPDAGGKHLFRLTNLCGDVIANSNEYNNAQKRDKDREKVIKFFREQADIEGFHLIEHILLRPGKANNNKYNLLPVDIPGSVEVVCEHEKDPYSFRISVVLPSWPERFHNVNFRRFVEKTIRQETPAHIYPRICWIDLKQMRVLESAYKNWLVELTEKKPGLGAANALIDILFKLKNVYPVTKLHDCQDGDSDDPQVTLDYSAIGVM